MRFEVSTPAHVRELEILLSQTFDFPVRVRGIEQIAPWAVGRCRLAAASGSPIPETVIVKWLRSDANNFRTDPLQLLTERAGLQFLQRIGFTAVPRVFAARDDIVVMEDVSPRKALNQMLAERDSTAPVALQAFAQTLGELHAATVGRAESYYEMRKALGPIEPVDELDRFLGTHVKETQATFAGLGMSMSGPATKDLAKLHSLLAVPGPFRAFSNGDPGSNNFLVEGRDGRMIDFESAGYRHALADAACLHVPNSLWLTVGDPVADGTEEVYRRALAARVHEAEDDRRFSEGMAAACLGMAIERLGRFEKLDGRDRGHDSRVQLVFTLEAACRASEHHRSLLSLASWMHRVIQVLRSRWPDADVDTTQYQPFTPRSG